MLIPDRFPSLVLLAGFWIPPAAFGWAAAGFARRSAYAALTVFVLGWSAAWFLFQLNRIPPYIPGATEDPTYAPPEVVAGLAIVASALVLPGSAIACWLAFRIKRGRSRRPSGGSAQAPA